MDKKLIWFGISHLERLSKEEVKDLVRKYSGIHADEKLITEYKKMINQNIHFITIEDNEYPEKLKNIYDPPFWIYIKGDISILNNPSVAVIGSRNCSEYGVYTARKIGEDLAKIGIVVISGMAKGIDKFAHIGCINAGGKTIAVLGSGFDNVYPKENKKLFEKIVNEGGLVISEYPPEFKPLSMHFPARNRIISGLSDKVIVVEAGEKSGTFITVDYSIEQGKDIYAVPR